MTHTALITTEKKHEYPILIVDKKGDIGESLANELKLESLVVLVSSKEIASDENIVHVPFVKKIPTIPDNTYSHIFVIDEDFEFSKHTLKSFVKKASQDKAYLIFSTNYSMVDNAFLENTASSYEKLKIILLGDVFSEKFIFNKNNYVNKYILQAKEFGGIDVPGQGAIQVSPVYFDDVISKILETVFSGEEKNKLYYLFPKYKTTLLTLSSLFQKANPNIKINFVKEKKQKDSKLILPEEGKYLLSDTYNLSEKIKKIDFSFISINEPEEKKTAKYYGEEESSRINLSVVVFFLLFFLMLPLLSTLLFSFIGVNSLYLVKSSFEKNNLSLSKTSAEIAVNSFKLAEVSSAILSEEVSLVGRKSQVEDYRKKINSATEISQGIISLITASEKLKEIMQGTTKNPEEELNDLIINFKNAFYIYNKEKNTGIIPASINKKIADVIKISSATIDFWPDILGFKGEKTYLLLFQNNMELRPGGGFIGSYGILNVDKGKVKEFKIYDVYDADGQLRAHIEPPYPIRRHLPSIHWYLRDSNFNIDFSSGAVASAIFLNSEMHQAVDGVIGVDLSFIKNLLLVSGPVKVSDYNETVDADNFYQIIQSHVEKDFFPGSTQKKDFLRSFYNSLSTNLNENKKISYLSLLNTLANSIYEKHVIFAFNNPNQQATFSVNGWSSSLTDDRKEDKGNINDFIGINEANLGANKVNYFITRSISQKVNILDDGTVSESLTIAIKNEAEKNLLEKGIYKNYLRIITPLNSKLKTILIDGKEQGIVDAVIDPASYEKKNYKAPVGLEVQKENQGKNTIYGFLIILKQKELKTIQVQYDLNKKIDMSKNEINYSLKIFKQPGIDMFPYELSLNFPEVLTFIKGSTGIKNESNKSIFSSQITKDAQITINLSPK